MTTLPDASTASRPRGALERVRFVIPGSSPGARAASGLVLVLALVVLALHVGAYAFLCDDAFISFRYARNLAHGFGLVFNPGFERVEGYSNFLWVVSLAALERLGVEPARAALALSWTATLALWLLVVRFAARHAPPGGAWLAVLVPAALLAANRSFAVWASSGLETRAFELAVIAGVLSLAEELDMALAGGPLRLRSAWWFAIAALTRPDGILFGASALAAAAVLLARRSALDARRFARGVLPFVLLVAAHFAFRRAYYGAWLPNTYYAKVGGRTWWDAGFEYLAAFALEYALWLWLPLLALGAIAWARARAAHIPVLFAAAILPHALYVTSIGGDHFEYRPLDLYLPLLFLLAGRGAAELAGRGSAPRRIAITLILALAAWLSFELPWQSHLQFPARYLPGFPGGLTSEPERVPFLDPGKDLLYRAPGLRAAAEAHRALLRRLSRRFIGLRQEEHARFLATVIPEGERLRALVVRGVFPPDTYIATGAVGAIPYYSDLRTLDRLGLTDAVVARSKPQTSRVMAHDRSASFADGRGRGVDLWAADDVHFLWRVGAPHAIELVAQGVDFHAAAVDSDTYLLVMLPQRLARTAARFPNLKWERGDSDAFIARWFERGTRGLADSLARHDDDAVRRALAYLLLMQGRAADALRQYQIVLTRSPDDPVQLFYASECRNQLGDRAAARAGFERALTLALERGDLALAGRIQRRIASGGGVR